MLKFTRPQKPEGFQEKADRELAKIEDQLTDSPDKLTFNSSFWGNYKSHFMEAQHAKCGYCEIHNSSYGDVEHYRPKSVVEDLLEPGEERPRLHNVKGRKFKKSCQYGYWWLAYEWDNYLLACTLCNQPWKRALFPIVEIRPLNEAQNSEYPHRSPTREDVETPLLLNPFGSVTISQHLDFTSSGLIKPFNNSNHGKQTIITCGLDRPKLVEKRAKKAQRTMKLIRRFASAETGSEREKEIAEDLLYLGDEEDNFAGMVRILFERHSGGYSWNDLERYIEVSLQD